MKTLKITLALIVLLAAPAVAQEMGASDGHDLDALWAAAQQNHDLSQEDAVLLLEDRTVTVGDEGTLVTRIHRVVWIGTSLGIRSYADLRVPWNSATSTLDVEILRTWMDGRWWPDAQTIGETAVVHTLPYAVDHADDYTAMRETMLLHDGVELPCIMETAYTIAEQGPPTAGADGVFVIPQRDPAVRVEYSVRVPVGIDVTHEALNGAPEATVDENGVHSLTWAMDGVPGLKVPIASQPAAYEPAVVWTTWENKAALESVWQETIDAAAVADPVLTDVLDERLAGSLDPVRDTVAFWNEAVRTIHYPFRFWQLAPRPATRTWETGYGHPLDRAVLLTSLLRHIADDRTAVVTTVTEAGYGEVAPELPRLSGFDGVLVRVAGGSLGAWVIDANTDEMLAGEQAGRWPPTASAANHDQHLSLSLVPGEGDAWHGTGVYRVGNAFRSSYHGDAAAVEQQVVLAVQSILPGAEVSAIAKADASLHFAVELAEWPLDADERPTLTVGPLDGGIMDQLPGDIHLHDATRQSPVRLPLAMVETVELRLQVDDRKVSAPAPVVLAGSTGSFRLDVGREHGWLRVARRLDLNPEAGGTRGEGPPRLFHPAESWPELRALLLEAGEPSHGVIVLD